MRVAIYARVSTRDKQDNDNQLHQLVEFCHRQGWTIAHEYTDKISGKTADRPQFQAMFEAAAQRKFDLLLFWSLDRLSREGALATLVHLQKLSSYGIAFRSYSESYLDTLGPFGEAVIAILAVIAKQERLRLSERVHAGLQRARREGRIGGRPPANFNRKRAV